MSKTILNPVKHFRGTVVLADPLIYPQGFAFEDAVEAAEEFKQNIKKFPRFCAAMEPGIMACVEEWHLENMPAQPNRLPASPRDSAAELAAWLIVEITAQYKEADEIPNA